MNIICKLLIALLLLSFPAAAEAQGEVQSGTGLVCDTAEQVERYVSLISETRNPHESLTLVNAEAPGEKNVCAVIAVVFTTVRIVKEVRTPEGAMDLAEIRWVGIPIGQVIGPEGAVVMVQPLPEPVVQYTLFRKKGEDV